MTKQYIVQLLCIIYSNKVRLFCLYTHTYRTNLPLLISICATVLLMAVMS